MNLGFQLLGKFKQDAQQLRSETDQLMTQLCDKVEEVHSNVQPEIYADYKQMKTDIRQ